MSLEGQVTPTLEEGCSFWVFHKAEADVDHVASLRWGIKCSHNIKQKIYDTLIVLHSSPQICDVVEQKVFTPLDPRLKSDLKVRGLEQEP